MRIFLLSLSCCVFLSTFTFAETVKVVNKKPCYQVLSDERPLFDYRYAETTYKPYVSKLYTPSGINILRDSPSDHIHHHAMMLAFMIDGTNFWEEFPNQKPGKQVTTSINTQADGITSKLDWVKPDGEKAATEQRTVQAVTLEGKGFKRPTMLNWCSTLACPEGREKVALSGRHYFGLGLRFVESMDNGGRFFFGQQKEASQSVRGDEQVTQARWAAYTAKVDGKPVTVAVFDSPKNPFPMYTFTMGDAGPAFAYLSATLNLHRVPRELEAGKPLTLCWGVALWDGETSPTEVETAYQAWKNDKSH